MEQGAYVQLRAIQLRSHSAPIQWEWCKSQTMYKYILQSVENVNWLAVIALLVFFVTFLLSVLWAFISKKEHMDEMSKLPLDDDEEGSNRENGNREQEEDLLVKNHFNKRN